MKKIINENDIKNFEKRYRVKFINSLTGAKSANLIGSISSKGVHNLAMFSSCVHMGASPPLIAFINRPQRDGAIRHTLGNILETKIFTINDVHPSILLKAHQTSARYDEGVSEFEAVGLTPETLNNFGAPFVKESNLKIGCHLVEAVPIKHNDTVMIIGEIKFVEVNDESIDSEGRINRGGVVSVTGLDTYYELTTPKTLSYAKKDKATKVLK